MLWSTHTPEPVRAADFGLRSFEPLPAFDADEHDPGEDQSRAEALAAAVNDAVAQASKYGAGVMLTAELHLDVTAPTWSTRVAVRSALTG